VAGYCGRHLPKARRQIRPPAKPPEKPTSTAEKVVLWTAALTGVVGLVEKIAEVWTLLPFGHGPKMPPDYEYLLEGIPADFQLEDSDIDYIPFNKGPDTIDWREARRIYDEAVRFLERPDEAPNEQQVLELEERLQRLVDATPNSFQSMFNAWLGYKE
jgi:hypothetical protein